MKLKSIAVLVTFMSLLGGCVTAPQIPVKATEKFWTQKDIKVGIVTTSITKPNVYLPGAACLLCIAVAETANAALSQHVDTISVENDLSELKTTIAERLEEKGIQVQVIDEFIDLNDLASFRSKLENSAKKDFSSFKNDNNLTHLVVIKFGLIGMHRTYSNYIPTSDPKGVFSGVIYLVDLESNTYESYEAFEIFKAAGGKWKEPPAYPALTNSFYQAIEMGKEIITESIFR